MLANIQSRVTGFFSMDPTLNYSFLLKVYIGLTLLSGLLCLLQFQFEVTSITGFWLVPAPCLFCLPFLYYRSVQQQKAGVTSEVAAKKEQ